MAGIQKTKGNQIDDLVRNYAVTFEFGVIKHKAIFLGEIIV